MSELLLATLFPIENGPFSYSDRKGNGTDTVFTFSFYGPAPGYLRASDVRPFLRDSDPNSPTYQLYTELVYDDNPWDVTGVQISFTTGIEATIDGENNLRIRRVMPKEFPYFKTDVDNVFRKEVINASFLQQLYAQHEVLDGFTGSAKAQSDLDMNFYRIKNLSPAIADGDAVNYSQFLSIVDGTTEAILLAYRWSQEGEDVIVDDGIRTGYSAFHWSEKSADHAAASANSADDSMGFRDESETYKNFSYAWASFGEDILVSDGFNPDGYSAFHWATKSAAYYANIANFTYSKSQIDNALALKPNTDTVILKSHGTTGGVDVPRWADNASRPDMTGINKAVFGFNDSAEESELWNPVTNEWGGVGGGGIPPVKEVKTASFIASRNTMYGVNIGSGEQVVISVQAGLATNSWEGAGDYGKTLDSNTHFTWELDGEYFAQKNSNGEYTNRFTFDARNGWCVIQKREDGYWDWVYGLYGTDAEYLQNQLDKLSSRDILWSNPTPVNTGNITLDYPISDYKEFLVTIQPTASTSLETADRIVSAETLVNSASAQFNIFGTVDYYLTMQLTYVSDTELTVLTGASVGWGGGGFIKIKGIK